MNEVRGKAQGITPIWDDSKNSKNFGGFSSLNQRPRTAIRNGSNFDSLTDSKTLKEKLLNLENV